MLYLHCITAIKTFPIMFVFTVTSQHGPGGDNLTLTCVLTCTKECGKDFNLTWSGGSHNSRQSGLMYDKNTLINRLFLPLLSMASAELTCFVHREGDVMASKKWRTINRKYKLCYCCIFS